MPLRIDDSELLAGLDRLMIAIPTRAEAGLQESADIMQDAMQDTSAHGDVTGATRASYRAFVIGGAHTGASESASGLAAALANNPAHALSQDSGVALGADQRGILLTSYTDYQEKLETENAGEKAVIGPTLQQFAPLVIQLVAKQGLR